MFSHPPRLLFLGQKLCVDKRLGTNFRCYIKSCSRGVVNSPVLICCAATSEPGTSLVNLYEKSRKILLPPSTYVVACHVAFAPARLNCIIEVFLKKISLRCGTIFMLFISLKCTTTTTKSDEKRFYSLTTT